jgi:hypothetical protein
MVRLSAIALLLLAGLPSALRGAEVASGSMLGPRYKADRFYVRNTPGGRWELTYSESKYRGKARGKLMVLRLAQGLFDDEWMTEYRFDPAANTERLVAALDAYKEHGVLAIAISLQGGNPGYSAAANKITRKNAAGLGEKQGLLVSAFRPDGSLKPEWLARLERVIVETNRRGMIVCLMYFYQGQDEVLESPETMLAGARNITDWLIKKNFRNVILDVANEWDIEGQTWDHGGFVPEYITQLVAEIRERFQDAEFTLPIGASTGGSMSYPESLARFCDVVILHGNGRTPGEKLQKVKQHLSYGRPVWMNEDDNGRETTPEHLALEKASADILFENAAGWGYMPWVQAQRFPFEFMPGPTAEFTAETPVEERDRAYFKAVLEHIARLVLKKPPSTISKKRKN